MVATALVLLIFDTAMAQTALPDAAVLTNPSSGKNLSLSLGKTPYEFWLTVMIGLFGLSVIGALMFSLRRVAHARPEDISRPIIVVTVISGTLMLVTVGYSNEQIAPAFGLFGTIVGYMLGRFSQTNPAQPASQTGGADVPSSDGTAADKAPGS
jgi:hypothetical protein